MIVRKNITIEEPLWRVSVAHAQKSHFTDFSGLVVKLLLEDLQRTEYGRAALAAIAKGTESQKMLDQLIGREDAQRSSRSVKAARKAS